MKPCPFCAEDVQDAAIVCKHCQRDLAPPVDRSTLSGRDLLVNPQPPNWTVRILVIIAVMVCLALVRFW